jgi:serine/threonine protein kinase
MSFEKAIQLLLSSGQKEINTGDWRIIKIKENQKKQFYAINIKESLGSGSYGIVYCGYPIDIETAQINKQAPYAIKVSNFNSYLTTQLEMEENIASHYYKTKRSKRIGKKTYQFMELIDAEQIRSDNHTIHSDLKNLEFKRRIYLVCNIILQYNSLHHHTPSTGPAVVHCDTKGSNILINLKDNRQDAFIIDFGLAMKMSGNPKIIAKHYHVSSGSPVYCPIETLKGAYGLKTDIYMLVHVIAIILGVKNPYALKQKHKKNPKAQALAKFCLNGIIDFPKIITDINIKPLVLQFLNQMQSNPYHDRPDIDVVLRFFISLNMLLETYASTPDDIEALNIHAAKFILVAENRWADFENYDFDGNPDFCKTVIKLKQENLPINNIDTITLILQNQEIKPTRLWKQTIPNLVNSPDFKQIIARSNPKELFEIYTQMKQHHNFIKTIIDTNRIDEVLEACSKKLGNDFTKAYKATCWFSFFGNVNRSEMGAKVFKGQITHIEDAIQYAQKHPNNASSRALDKIINFNQI